VLGFCVLAQGLVLWRPWEQHPKWGGKFSTAGKLTSMSARGSDHYVKLKPSPNATLSKINLSPRVQTAAKSVESPMEDFLSDTSV